MKTFSMPSPPSRLRTRAGWNRARRVGNRHHPRCAARGAGPREHTATADKRPEAPSCPTLHDARSAGTAGGLPEPQSFTPSGRETPCQPPAAGAPALFRFRRLEESIGTINNVFPDFAVTFNALTDRPFSSFEQFRPESHLPDWGDPASAHGSQTLLPPTARTPPCRVR
jgi:hypothetical protein